MGRKALGKLACLIALAFVLPAEGGADYVREWRSPEGLRFATDASRHSFTNERYDMENDGVPELLLREENPDYPGAPRWIYHVYSAPDYELRWSYTPVFPSNESEFFGFYDIDDDGEREALFDDDGQNGGVMCVSWASGEVEWQLAYGTVAAMMDFDADGAVELAIWSYFPTVLEVWGAGEPAGVRDERAHAQPSVISAVRVSADPRDRGAAIRFEIGRSGSVAVTIFDAQGRVVRVLLEAEHAAGSHLVHWDGCGGDGRRAAAGTYFCEVRTGSEKRGAAFVVIE